MKSNTIKLLESIQNNLNEEDNYPYDEYQEIDTLPEEYETHFNKLKEEYFTLPEIEIKKYQYNNDYIVCVKDIEDNTVTYIMYRDNKVKVDKYPGWNYSKNTAKDINLSIDNIIDDIININYQ